MRNTFNKKCLLIIILWCVTGCAISSFKGNDAAVATGKERPSFNSTYHYSLGVLHILDENLNEAIKEYEEALRFDPQAQFLTNELISLYIEKGEIPKAILLCKNILIDNPGNINARLLLGGLYLNMKDYKNAIGEYEKVIELDPSNSVSYLYLGTIYAENKNYEKAFEIFKNLINIHPDHLTGNYYLAKILTEMKRYEEAEESFKKTLAIKPLFEPALIDLGLLYEKQKKTDRTIEIYKSYIDIHPTGINVRIKLGEIFLREHKLNEAEKEFKEILTINNNREARLNLGYVYLEKNQYEQAIDAFLLLLKGNPHDHRARYLLASTYEEKKVHNQAIEEFKMIPVDSELYGNAQIQIGMILKKGGKIDEAIAVMKRAINTNRRISELYAYLATLYEDNKKLLPAEETLKEGLLVLPQSVDLHYSLGVLYEKTDRFQESIHEMESVLKIDPDNAEALNFMGYTFADRGIRLAEAEKMINKALTLKPGNGYMIDSLGWVYFRQSRLDLAIKYLKEALNAVPNDATIAEHLGDAYTKAGKVSEAIEMYRRALRLNPANNDLQKKIDELIKSKMP
jgi:tetratricopeptide (TPR) repeat protein